MLFVFRGVWSKFYFVSIDDQHNIPVHQDPAAEGQRMRRDWPAWNGRQALSPECHVNFVRHTKLLKSRRIRQGQPTPGAKGHGPGDVRVRRRLHDERAARVHLQIPAQD